MAVDVIIGLQWGDEGKGKIVDYLAANYDIVARFQGGPNAGHTLKFDGKKFVLHTVPSGIFRPTLLNLIGNGVVINPTTLKKEIEGLKAANVDYKDRLLVSKKAHLIMPTHLLLDAASESAKGKSKIGSTLKGIGPTYMDKTGRNGLRMGDILSPQFKAKYHSLRNKHLNLLRVYPPIDMKELVALEQEWFASLEELKELQFVDGEYYINQALKDGKKVLAEGAQGAMLDIDFGTYPYVTSSSTMTAGVCAGLGVAPSKIGEVIGITKAYCTRVGGGPFPTELDNEAGERLRRLGSEFGATTGRPRRCGWIDLPALKYAIMISGVTQICMTKIDILNEFEEISVATQYHYEGQVTENVPYDLATIPVVPIYETHKGWQVELDDVKDYNQFPQVAKDYIQALEEKLGTPITFISTGPEREKLVHRKK
jgi:adenylosuccinate synthase